MTTRADRMAALERLAAPGSGATEPERATAQRFLDRMRADGPAEPAFSDDFWAWVGSIDHRVGWPRPPMPPMCRCEMVEVEVEHTAAPAPDKFRNMRFRVEINGVETSCFTAVGMSDARTAEELIRFFAKLQRKNQP
jgi:hypothetical protein